MSRLVLIDGNAILHRAFHALPAMTNSKGQEINAVYGFVSMVFNVIKELKPTHLAITFDRPKPTFRKELFTAYQAQRPKMDDSLVDQASLVHKVVAAMEVPIYEKDGFEADDVIGSLARQATETLNNGSRHAELVQREAGSRSAMVSTSTNSQTSTRNPKGILSGQVRDDKGIIKEVIVVTGDRDLLQLVNTHVKLFMPVKGLSEAKLFGEQEAEERMGVPPAQIADLKGLMGDPSDNYPGVAGIGPKTAITLLKEFGSVENIYKNLDKIKNQRVVEKLVKDKDNALMSHKLATVVTDVPIEFDHKSAELHDLATRKAVELFSELEFKTLLKRLLNLHSKQSEPAKPAQAVVKKDNQLGLF